MRQQVGGLTSSRMCLGSIAQGRQSHQKLFQYVSPTGLSKDHTTDGYVPESTL